MTGTRADKITPCDCDPNNKSAARPLGLAEFESRAFPVRLRDGLARLLSPYL